MEGGWGVGGQRGRGGEEREGEARGSVIDQRRLAQLRLRPPRGSCLTRAQLRPQSSRALGDVLPALTIARARALAVPREDPSSISARARAVMLLRPQSPVVRDATANHRVRIPDQAE